MTISYTSAKVYILLKSKSPAIDRLSNMYKSNHSHKIKLDVFQTVMAPVLLLSFTTETLGKKAIWELRKIVRAFLN